jgi:hypothetical protein
MSDRHCEHCRFAHDAGFEWLFCHRFPPTYAPRDPRLRPCLEREWPSVHKQQDWCGEFQPVERVESAFQPVEGTTEAAPNSRDFFDDGRAEYQAVHTFGTPNTVLLRCPACWTSWFGRRQETCPKGCGVRGRDAETSISDL